MSSTSYKVFNGSSSGSEEQITSDWRIQGYKPLIPPQILEMEIPMSDNARRVVSKAREECVNVLNRTDDRLLVVVGPCSIHDTFSAVEYAKKLKELNEELKGELLIIMRAYFEKPRTTVGWKGLINDPDLNESYQINKGLRVGRQLLQDLNELGVPVGGELLDTITPQFLGEFFSWGAIGARTTESQLHRELASGVSFPVGFKNGTDGNAKIAIDAIKAASHPHHFLGITHQGLASISVTKGNEDCHIILRGGNAGPNYEKQYVDKITEELTNAKLTPNIMVDCSHGNSRKKHENQILVAKDLEEQIINGNKDIIGVMIESNLKAGRQDLPPQGAEGLKFGVSITDACIAWDDTISVLKGLAEAIKVRRSKAN